MPAHLFWWRFVFGFQAFAAVLVIFWLMATRPPLPVWNRVMSVTR
jgi:uncharacterized membrane protein